MDTWGPDEWALAWQSAPAHVREGSGGSGHAGTGGAGAVAGSTAAEAERVLSGRGSSDRRPPDGRPSLRRPGARRPTLTRRTAGTPEVRPAEGGAGSADAADLEHLETRIRGMAADLAASLCEWLHLVERFDREGGWAGVGLASCAAWLSWTCSVAPGTAREYVRVARALPLLPLIDEAFAAGRLSYSKVRVLIQVAAEVDEAVLLQQAQVQTVSQLERTVRAFRRTDGWSQQRKRRAVWRWDEDGMLVVSARLPADEGALFVAAMERARDDIMPRPDGDAGGSVAGGSDADGSDAGDSDAGDSVAGDASPGPTSTGTARQPMPEPTDADRQRAALTDADPLGTAGADMLLALASRALAAGDVDSSGDDRHLVVLHADLDQLAGDGESGVAPSAGDGESGLDPRCHLENGPGLDRRTARRIACDAAIVEVLHHVGEGEPLRLGRKTRKISPAQRRALRIRDGGCRFHGCHRRKYLDAHHVRFWSLQGPTDLENLVLLCTYHHMLVHEGGFRVAPGPGGRWEFRDPHGDPIASAPSLPGGRQGTAPPIRAADPFGLMPAWAGEPFHLAETVGALLDSPRVVVGHRESVADGDPR